MLVKKHPQFLRHVFTLTISENTVSNLTNNGYNHLDDVTKNPESYKHLTERELEHLMSTPKIVDSTDLYYKEPKIEKIRIPSRTLNQILDGGFHCGTMTELCGGMGSGKTQICFQASIAVQLDKRYGGLKGKVIYIDTRDGFSPLRVTDLIQGYRNRHRNLLLNEENLLKNIAVYSPKTVSELYDIIDGLKKSCGNHPEIRLLIVDSLSHLIQFSNDSWHRTRTYFYTLKLLRDLTHSNIAVIVTSEMKTQIQHEERNFQLVSSGGDVTANQMNRRLLLARRNQNEFAAKIVKAQSRQMAVLPFKITSDGIEDSPI
ncbi:DNA repair protein RAD51 homolog 3-like [Leptopilina heterotoma]|uniref:DNA repair protein RAD51 homolog 3-like n=1 Tax=Leptopilina heterotoma TaxID=63436 RepID=UPI001CA7BAF8|nr:DNA repair protein RAD51 homolog 3-like [Leptopilina heterotoma]